MVLRMCLAIRQLEYKLKTDCPPTDERDQLIRSLWRVDPLKDPFSFLSLLCDIERFHPSSTVPLLSVIKGSTCGR